MNADAETPPLAGAETFGEKVSFTAWFLGLLTTCLHEAGVTPPRPSEQFCPLTLSPKSEFGE